jgi:hypothetical protein
MEVTFINATQHNGNRWLVSPTVGFIEKGYTVNWLGLQMGGFQHLYNGWTEECPTPINGLNLIPSYTEEEAIKCIKESEIVVFNINHGDYLPIGIHNWAKLLNKYRPYDFFIFLGLDCQSGDYAQEELYEFKYQHYLRREAYTWYKDIAPFVAMSTHKEWNHKQEKTIDVSCLFGGNNGNPRSGYVRPAIINAVRSCIPNSVIGTRQDAYSFNEYLDVIASSKISVSAPGNGHVCYRDFEILSNETIMATKKLPTTHFDDFVDMESIIFYTTPDELVSKCSEVLDDDDLYNDILSKQIATVGKYHTPLYRAEQLLQFKNIKRKDNYYES